MGVSFEYIFIGGLFRIWFQNKDNCQALPEQFYHDTPRYIPRAGVGFRGARWGSVECLLTP